MLRLEEVMNHHRPDWVVVYGDTNSTLAASVAAAQLHLPTAHIEAGLRSFDRSMPEEINRIVADHLGSLLLAPTRTAVHNLKREGLVEAVRQVGDVRVDVLWQVEQHAEQQIKRLCEQARQRYGSFALATIHRQANTDYYERLHAIISALKQAGLTVVLPVHPRLRKQMAEFDLEFGSNVVPIDPVGIVEMIALLKACEIVITDSGGLQKEAYLFRRPAVTLRDSTEWVETVETGWNRLSEPEPSAFLAAVEAARRDPPAEHPNLYGTYGVSERIIALLEQNTAA
jgi:UDP-N-acetylglucosamine 2-epimerase